MYLGLSVLMSGECDSVEIFIISHFIVFNTNKFSALT